MRKLEYPLTFGIVVAAMTLGATMSNAQTSRNTTICAEREITLEMLIESDGAAPSASSTVLNNNAASLMEARGACDNGHITAAVGLYDRIIAEVSAAGMNAFAKAAPLPVSLRSAEKQ